MKRKVFVYIGNWSFEAAPAKGKGVSTFRMDEETGELEYQGTILPEIAAGQLFLDQERAILYANDECGSRPGRIGGGGGILSFAIDRETGSLTELNRRDTLCPEPSYLCLDKGGQYLTVCHCADPFLVNKVVKVPDGGFENQVLFDDTTLDLFRVEPDGSIGRLCDVSILPAGEPEASRRKVDPVSGHIQLVRVISRLHSVVASPSGDLLAVCDKGMDRVYTYRVDREAGRLIRLGVWEAPETACFPRYAAFHPTLNALYVNNENFALLNVFHFDEDSGALGRYRKVYLLPEDPGLVDGKPVGAQDILVHPNGKVLYCTLCGLNLIVVCRLDAHGVPVPTQRIPARGNLPRGIALSPDGRFLLCGNMVSGDVTLFAADQDGLLTDMGKTFPAVSPSAIRFFVSEE